MKFQVVKARHTSSAKRRCVVCSPGCRMSVVKSSDTSLQTRPLRHESGRGSPGITCLPWRRPREGRRDAGCGTSFERRLALRIGCRFRLDRSPTCRFCRAVVKRSDTSLLTTRTRVRIPPGGNTRSSVDRARAAEFERAMRRLRFRLFPDWQNKIGGGEEVAFFGSVKAVEGMLSLRAPPLPKGEGSRLRLFPANPSLKIQSRAVVKISVTSLATHEMRVRIPSGPSWGPVAQR